MKDTSAYFINNFLRNSIKNSSTIVMDRSVFSKLRMNILKENSLKELNAKTR